MIQQQLHNVDLITLETRTCCHMQRRFSEAIPDVDVGVLLMTYLEMSSESVTPMLEVMEAKPRMALYM
jgi:hypothetical protein